MAAFVFFFFFGLSHCLASSACTLLSDFSTNLIFHIIAKTRGARDIDE